MNHYTYLYRRNFPNCCEKYIGRNKYSFIVSHFELFFSLLISLLPDFDHNWAITEDGLFYDLNCFLLGAVHSILDMHS